MNTHSDDAFDWVFFLRGVSWFVLFTGLTVAYIFVLSPKVGEIHSAFLESNLSHAYGLITCLIGAITSWHIRSAVMTKTEKGQLRTEIMVTIMLGLLAVVVGLHAHYVIGMALGIGYHVIARDLVWGGGSFLSAVTFVVIGMVIAGQSPMLLPYHDADEGLYEIRDVQGGLRVEKGLFYLDPFELLQIQSVRFLENSGQLFWSDGSSKIWIVQVSWDLDLSGIGAQEGYTRMLRAIEYIKGIRGALSSINLFQSTQMIQRDIETALKELYVHVNMDPDLLEVRSLVWIRDPKGEGLVAR